MLFSTVSRGTNPLAAAALTAVGTLLNREAADGFRHRRWHVTLAPNDECNRPDCYDRVASTRGANHWLVSRVARQDEQCVVEVVLHSDPAAAKNEVRRRATATPCSADNLLRLAAQLGRAISNGPRWSNPPSFGRSDPSLDLDIRDLPRILPYTTSSVSPTRPVTLDEALTVYRANHLFVVDAPDDGFFIVRGNQPITECLLWQLVQVPPELYVPPPCEQRPCPPPRSIRIYVEPPPSPVAAYCRQNNWEWAWLGAPVGALVAAGSWSTAQEGRLEGIAFTSLGVLGAVTAVVLALTLDRDPPDPRTGKHASGRATIEALISRHNRDLRTALGLSVADVHLARLRP